MESLPTYMLEIACICGLLLLTNTHTHHTTSLTYLIFIYSFFVMRLYLLYDNGFFYVFFYHSSVASDDDVLCWHGDNHRPISIQTLVGPQCRGPVHLLSKICKQRTSNCQQITLFDIYILINIALLSGRMF